MSLDADHCHQHCHCTQIPDAISAVERMTAAVTDMTTEIKASRKEQERVLDRVNNLEKMMQRLLDNHTQLNLEEQNRMGELRTAMTAEFTEKRNKREQQQMATTAKIDALLTDGEEKRRTIADGRRVAVQQQLVHRDSLWDERLLRSQIRNTVTRQFENQLREERSRNGYDHTSISPPPYAGPPTQEYQIDPVQDTNIRENFSGEACDLPTYSATAGARTPRIPLAPDFNLPAGPEFGVTTRTTSGNPAARVRYEGPQPSSKLRSPNEMPDAGVLVPLRGQLTSDSGLSSASSPRPSNRHFSSGMPAVQPVHGLSNVLLRVNEAEAQPQMKEGELTDSPNAAEAVPESGPQDVWRVEGQKPKGKRPYSI
eukprot:m.121326 g.121326  ORF g.121326 m.121326 type:complete len:369 (+) comp37750_c0_seq8:76-1182(+)